MLIDYYLASRLGRLWLRLHPALNASIGDGPDLCLTVAQDRQIQPAHLFQAQAFAARVWWRAGLVAVVLVIPVGIATAISPRPTGTDIGTAAMLALLALMAVAEAQAAILIVRARLTGRYLRDGGTKPLDAYEGGYPTPYDFWAGGGVAVAVAAILAYAGLH